MQNPHRTRCLLLACGNTLRGDDGVGHWLAHWAAERFSSTSGLRVIANMQWTPELAEDLAHAETAIFIDATAASAPGAVQILPVVPAAESLALSTHHLDAPALLALSRKLYASHPRDALVLTVGLASTELAETFSPVVQQALPRACELLEGAVLRLLSTPQNS